MNKPNSTSLSGLQIGYDRASILFQLDTSYTDIFLDCKPVSQGSIVTLHNDKKTFNFVPPPFNFICFEWCFFQQICKIKFCLINTFKFLYNLKQNTFLLYFFLPASFHYIRCNRSQFEWDFFSLYPAIYFRCVIYFKCCRFNSTLNLNKIPYWFLVV